MQRLDLGLVDQRHGFLLSADPRLTCQSLDSRAWAVEPLMLTLSEGFLLVLSLQAPVRRRPRQRLLLSPPLVVLPLSQTLELVAPSVRLLMWGRLERASVHSRNRLKQMNRSQPDLRRSLPINPRQDSALQQPFRSQNLFLANLCRYLVNQPLVLRLPIRVMTRSLLLLAAAVEDLARFLNPLEVPLQVCGLENSRVEEDSPLLPLLQVRQRRRPLQRLD